MLSIPRNTQLWLLTYFFSTYLELSSIVQFFHQNIHVIASLGHFPYCYYSYLAQWKNLCVLDPQFSDIFQGLQVSKKHNYSICICQYHFYQFGSTFPVKVFNFFFESYRITMLNIGKWSNEEAICCFAFTNNTIERCGVVFCRCAFMIR